MPIDVQQLKSFKILHECQQSLDLLEQVPDGDKQLFRIYWMFCLVSLRQVNDALEKSDIVAHPKMREPYECRKDELFALKDLYHNDTPFTECSLDYLIYHRLIHGERNIAVHEAKQTYSDSWTYWGQTARSTWGTSTCQWAISTSGVIVIAAIGYKKGLIGGGKRFSPSLMIQIDSLKEQRL